MNNTHSMSFLRQRVRQISSHVEQGNSFFYLRDTIPCFLQNTNTNIQLTQFKLYNCTLFLGKIFDSQVENVRRQQTKHNYYNDLDNSCEKRGKHTSKHYKIKTIVYCSSCGPRTHIILTNCSF